MIHVAELDTGDTVDTGTSHDTAADMKTLAIVGGTGGTGKWAVKGALVRGYKVRLLARNLDKVPKVLATVFDEAEVEKHQENVHVVKGGAGDEAEVEKHQENVHVVKGGA